VARVGPTVWLRDSTNPQRVRWAAFLDTAKTGGFDDLLT
jgi:hypothetical protein